MRKTIAFALLLLMSAAAAQAQNVLQTFSVSKKSPGTNTNPAIALNEKRGDVGVVWVHSDANNPGVSEVWFSLLKRNADGSLRVKKSQKISETAVRISSPTLVYNKGKNEYLAAWISANPAFASPADTDKIEVNTCRISRGGKVLALAVVYSIIALAYYSNPVLYYMQGALASPDPAARFMLFFSARGVPGGLFLMYLDALGRTLLNPRLIIEGEEHDGQYLGIVCNSIVAGPGNVLLLGLTLLAFQNSQFSPRTLLVSMTGLGVLIHTLVLQATFSRNVQILPLSATLLLVAWWSGELQSYVMRQVLFPELIFFGALLSPLRAAVNLWALAFIAVAADIYYLFGSPVEKDYDYSPAAPGDWIYARKINDKKGKPGGKDKQLFNHQGKLRSLVGVGLPNGNEDARRWPVLLIWQKFVSSEVREIRGVVIKP